LAGLIHIGKVRSDEFRTASLSRDVPGDGLAPLRVPAADDKPRRAPLGKGAGDGLAKALGASRDDRDGIF
jgi:hypothetical protein